MAKSKRECRPRVRRLFALYEVEVRKIAGGVARKTGNDADELYSEGLVGFMRAVRSWDPDKGKFTPWLKRKLRHGMIDYIRKTDRVLSERKEKAIVAQLGGKPDQTISDILQNHHHEWVPDKRMMWKERMLDLSPEAKVILSVILDDPTEILSISKSSKPKAIRGAIMRWLREEGWSWNKIWKTFTELKTVCK